MTSDGFGHVLDMLGHCNAYGAVTIAGMGPGSGMVTVAVSDGRHYREHYGPTLTLALERMARNLERERKAGGWGADR